MKDRLSNDAIAEVAVQIINSESKNNLPTYFRKSYEIALEEAENSQNVLKKHFATKGGKAAKEDALQKYIIKCVRLNSKITESQLLNMLMNQKGHGLIDDIDDDVISFSNPNGTIKDAPVTGLKDRLSRAKKKISSR
jgi:hypothetical protein